MNHVDMDIVCWIMVHVHTGIMSRSSFRSRRAGLSRPYFGRSHLTLVYMMKNISDTSSARLDPIAAPMLPEIDRIMSSWQDMLTQDLSEAEQELLAGMLQKMKSRASGYLEE